MSFYSIYFIKGLVELHPLEQEYLAIAQQGRLISTHKGYERAWKAADAMAQEKRMPFIDRTEVTTVTS